jgi:hypothetical protein
VVNTVLANRRLFARPLGRTPSLHTVNSLGTAFVGAAERAPDGTHIATHALVIFFKLPLLPLGAYVVREQSGGSWQIFARVPLGTFAWLYGRTLALAAIASVLFAALGAFHASRNHDVRVLNPFGKAVTASIAGRTAVVPPHRDAILDVPVGKQKARATVDGAVVDELEIEVQSGRDELVWNLAGGMPAFLIDVRYSAKSVGKPPPPPEPREIFCGKRFFRARADFVFREPDKRVSMPKGASSVTRTLLAYPPGLEDPVRLCAGKLDREGRLADAIPFLEARAMLAGWKGDVVGAAITALQMVEPKRAAEVADKARKAAPGDVEVHRMYQSVAMGAGLTAEVETDYRKRAEAAPDDPDAQYLHLRLLRGPDALALHEKAAARFPRNPHLLRALTWVRYRSGDVKGGSEAWQRLRAVSPKHAALMGEVELHALASQGKRAEALSLAQSLFEAADVPSKRALARAYARLATLEGAADRDALISKIEAQDDGEKAWSLRQQAGLPVPGSVKEPLTLLERAVATDPKVALSLTSKAGGAEMMMMERASWALLFAEAVRAGDSPAEQALLRLPMFEARELPALRSYVRGEAATLDDLDEFDDVLGALALVRSRNAALPEAERASLRTRAAQLDPLRGPVTAALASWKP